MWKLFLIFSSHRKQFRSLSTMGFHFSGNSQIIAQLSPTINGKFDSESKKMLLGNIFSLQTGIYLNVYFSEIVLDTRSVRIVIFCWTILRWVCIRQYGSPELFFFYFNSDWSLLRLVPKSSTTATRSPFGAISMKTLLNSAKMNMNMSSVMI